MTACVALIVAGGRGERFGGEVPKQYLELGGEPVLRHTVRALLGHPRIDAIRVVIREGDEQPYAAATAGLDLLPPVHGGASRQASVRQGLESLDGNPPALVLVHDAARPWVPPALVDRVLDALAASDGAVPAIPVADTLKRAEPAGPALRVTATVERRGLWRAQTPQGFRFAPLLAAHRRFADAGLTDDAAVAEAAGLAVAVVPGSEDNLKITTPEDLDRIARTLAAAGRAPECGGGVPDLRVGSGFDVHRFGPGDQVILAGVAIPHTAGLAGHSDADVALHAITDALLGAIAAGDIGQHFPPSDPQWRAADSALFLAHAAGLVRAAGGRIQNIDLTIICERPKIGPHRAAMVAGIAAILGIPTARVNVKATTTERLGFTGRGEGIAAEAVAAVLLTGQPASAG